MTVPVQGRPDVVVLGWAADHPGVVGPGVSEWTAPVEPRPARLRPSGRSNSLPRLPGGGLGAPAGAGSGWAPAG
ncbi:hypothetical protein, partial [Actinoalloteichus caeruleus]|uniref:hypothetical protein n=1 Tax=Actinoalloteichus cyanogriseus TaxID=2893586 RepID=UPI001B80511A